MALALNNLKRVDMPLNKETKPSKNLVYIIECSKCKEIYIGSTQALNTRTSLHRSNIKIEGNRKLNVSKHLCKCSQGKFKIMPIYQTNYMLLQIKEKNFIDEFKPKLNKIWIVYTHKWKQTYTYIYTHTKKKKFHDIHSHTQRKNKDK